MSDAFQTPAQRSLQARFDAVPLADAATVGPLFIDVETPHRVRAQGRAAEHGGRITFGGHQAKLMQGDA